MPKISKHYLITIGIAVVMLIFWFAFAQIRWLIVLVSSVLLGLLISHLFIAFVNSRVTRQFAFLNRQLRVHLDIPETDMFNFQWIYPSLQGEYLRRRIQVYTSTHEVPDREREVPFTTISVNASFGGRSFSIRPEALGKKFTKFFYNKKRVTEEKSFDRKFEVNGDDLKYVGDLLDGPIREILSQGILSRDSFLEFKNGQFSYTEQTVMNSGFKRRRFEKIILVMYMIAKKMEMGGRPAPLPEPKVEEVLPPELSELLEEEEVYDKKGNAFDFDDDDLDLGMDEDMFAFDDTEEEEEEEHGMGGRRLQNETEGSRQLDLFGGEGRKLDTSNEDLFRDGIEDGGKLSEEGIDSKKEKEKKEKEAAERSAKEEKKKPKATPEPEPEIEPELEMLMDGLGEEDFGFDFGAGDEDLGDLERDGDDFDLDDINFDDMEMDEDFDLDGMDFDNMDFDLDDMDLDDMDMDFDFPDD